MSRCLTKIVIKDFTSSVTMSGITLYDYNGKINYSIVNSESTTEADLPEATITSTYALSSNLGNFLKAPSTNTWSISSNYTTEQITITFKSGFEVDSLTAIDFSISAGTANVEFYNEDNLCVYALPIIVSNKSYDLEALHLFVYKAYTMDPQYVETKAGSNLSSVNGSILSIKLECNIPTSTIMKFFLSFDGRNTWYTYGGGQWVDVTTNYLANKAGELILNGMTETILSSLSQAEFDLITPTVIPYDVDVAIGMKTNDSSITPHISRIILNYI